MSDSALNTIGFHRLGLIEAAPTSVTPAAVVPYMRELARLGVSVTNPDAVTDAAVTAWPALRQTIVELRGGGRSYAPLFPGFPDKLPSSDHAVLRFWLAGNRLAMLAAERAGTDSSSATVVAFDADDLRAALDFSSIGWWPASSVPQDIDADALAKVTQDALPSDNRIEWIRTTFVSDVEFRERLQAFMFDCLYSSSALREEVRADVEVLLDTFGVDDIDVAQIRIAETRALLTARLFRAAATDTNAAAQLADGDLSPDDLLRMFATVAGGDVSLHEPLRVPKMNRAQRRVVMACLEATPRIRDMYRRRGLWLTVTRSIHAGEFAERYPSAGAVIAELRAGRYDATSVLSRFEHALERGAVADAISIVADEAPTLLIRNLRRLASLAAGDTDHLAALEEALRASSATVPLRALLGARAQILDNGKTYPRLAITKAGGALYIDRPVGHLAVDTAAQASIVAALDDALLAACAAKGSWEGQRIWIDTATSDLLVPDQLRSTSDSLASLERGSRVPLGTANVLRLFVHWRQPAGESSDLDLSCVALDDTFRVVEQVSWTNLANGAMTHSGDLTSAPNGASEFIDIRLGALAKFGWRYLAPSIYKFSGPRFADLPEAVAGWMLRDDCSTDRETFDLATVAHAFALTGSAGSALPFVYDIVTNEMIYLDAYLPARPSAMVENQTISTQRLGSTVASRRAIKANVAELARLHTQARGGVLVADRDDATITFGIDDRVTYNALRPAALLADLL